MAIDLSERPDGISLRAFDAVIIRPDAKIDLETLHDVGTRVLAMVDVRDLAAGSEAEREAQVLEVPFARCDRPGRVRMDVRHGGWLTVVVRMLLRPAAERGFSGFVLTGLETLAEESERAAAAQALSALRGMFPEKDLVLKVGSQFHTDSAHHLNGILLTGEEVAEAPIREAVKLGLKAYVVEFGKADETTRLEERARAIQAAGGIPFFTTAALDGINLGPLREVKRRVTVLHSGPVRETFTWKVLHGTLQWLGREVIYLEMKPGLKLETRASGVILDASLKLTATEQAELTQVVKQLAQQKVQLLITGLPWESLEALAEVGSVLGWQGSGARIQPVQKPSFGKLEMGALMRTGALTLRTKDFRDLRAPAGARVLLSIKSSAGSRKTFDAVHLADWGGLWLDSLAPIGGPQVSPVHFLSQWLGRETIPVLDVASRDSKRLLVAHVSSEGFAELSSTKGLPLAAEAMTGRILSKYKIPFTVSLCEGDVRGWTPGSDPRDALRYAQAARAMLALPNVEAASASLSRPNNWDGKAFEPGSLDAGGAQVRLSLEREIAGSLAFIHRQLLPVGKSVPLMMWPRSATPSPEALAFARKMGVESLQCAGSDLLPGVPAPLPPFYFDGVLCSDTLQGGNLDTATFRAEMESENDSAWESAMHLPLSFRDAKTERSLREVEMLLDWCQTQPLHAIAASEYAHLTRDAMNSRIYEAGPGHWVILNEGKARTLRLPEAAGVPDTSASRGITGYTVRGDQLYVHTDGGRRTELVLKTAPKAGRLQMAVVSGEVKVIETGAARQVFRVTDSQPARLEIAGLRAGAVCEMRAGRAVAYHTADAKGEFEFEAPGGALVQLQVISSRHAAAR